MGFLGGNLKQVADDANISEKITKYESNRKHFRLFNILNVIQKNIFKAW